MRFVFVALLGASSVTACGAAQHEAELRRRASYDFGCAGAALQMEEIEAGVGQIRSYGVSGCGRRAVYVLSLTGVWVMNSDIESTDARTGEDVPAEGREVAHRIEVGRVGGQRSVRARLFAPRVQYTFIGNDGEPVAGFLRSRTNQPLVDCERATFRGEETVELDVSRGRLSIPPESISTVMRASVWEVCGRVWTLDSEGQAAAAEFLERLQATDGSSSSGAAPRPGSRDPEAEAAIRQALSESAAVVHACVSAPGPVRTEVYWSGGSVSLRVTGASEQVSACIASAVPLRAPPGSGSLVHVVP